jgi:hypothetical protein
MNSVIVSENNAYKDWGLDYDWRIPTEKVENIIAIRQLFIYSLEIVDGFPKKMREF